MATVTESSESQITSARDNNLTGNSNARVLDETATFIDDAVRQAQFYQKALNDAVESALDASITRFSQIRSTSYAHFNQTLDSLDELKSQYNAYEDILFGKIKDGALVAASQPAITCGATAALGLVVLKRPRRMLYYNTLRLFVSEESLISRASAEVNELRISIDLLKAEGEKLQILSMVLNCLSLFPLSSFIFSTMIMVASSNLLENRWMVGDGVISSWLRRWVVRRSQVTFIGCTRDGVVTVTLHLLSCCCWLLETHNSSVDKRHDGLGGVLKTDWRSDDVSIELVSSHIVWMGAVWCSLVIIPSLI
ncbi:hypothetical protein TanjilG_20949 [Lupinus angustifolius]|uniref:Uncharacterized protein n=1 Tax=Lupinus angustifolius TaxID=3871 RepID=A0A1J7G562_LUPAN|nr:hypothetical protein TanjilG_20949 [Lupinus angustifolius]